MEVVGSAMAAPTGVVGLRTAIFVMTSTVVHVPTMLRENVRVVLVWERTMLVTASVCRTFRECNFNAVTKRNHVVRLIVMCVQVSNIIPVV